MTFKNNWEKADQYFQREKSTVEEQLLLSGKIENIQGIMMEVGSALAKIQS